MKPSTTGMKRNPTVTKSSDTYEKRQRKHEVEWEGSKSAKKSPKSRNKRKLTNHLGHEMCVCVKDGDTDMRKKGPNRWEKTKRVISISPHGMEIAVTLL